MGNTANYAFPWPAKGDSRNAPVDIKALADAIDSFLATEAANPQRPWWSFVRWTTGTTGTATDAPLIGYDLKESNFTLTTPVTNTGAIVIPRAGLYLVTVDLTYTATWSGNPQISVGAKTTSSPPREIFEQRNENNSTGGQRRSYSVSGMLRALVGEEIWCFMNQPGGTGTINHSNGASPGDRYASRFSGVWVGP